MQGLIDSFDLQQFRAAKVEIFRSGTWLGKSGEGKPLEESTQEQDWKSRSQLDISAAQCPVWRLPFASCREPSGVIRREMASLTLAVVLCGTERAEFSVQL